MISSTKRLERLQKTLKRQTLALETWRNRRLMAGLAAFVSLVLISAFRDQLWPALLLLASLLVLVILAIITKNISKFIKKLNSWKDYFERQQLRQSGQTRPALDIGQIPLAHQAVCEDLQLVGPSSLFGLFDESLTDGGQKLLLDRLLNSPVQSQVPRGYQLQVTKLAENPWALERFIIDHKLADSKISGEALKQNLARSSVSESFVKVKRLGFAGYGLGWGLAVLLVLLGSPLPPLLPPTIWFLLCLSLMSHTEEAFGRAQDYSSSAGALKKIFIDLKKDEPVRAFHQLEKILSALSARSNPIVYGLLNFLFPWDLYYCNKLENWRKEFVHGIDQSLHQLYEFEYALCGALMLHYQSTCMADYSEGQQPNIEGEKAFHPLIPRDQVVPNDFALGGSKSLCLITGSNMSGKSTFLRTVGVNHKLALMGFPVFAESFTTFAGPLRTCLHVTDSLEQGFSTFYAEVRKISEIIKAAHRKEGMIFLIDEIFRGTNNRERLEGSRSVIADLAHHPNVIGFVTTHDLELAQMEKDFTQLGNWHFADEIHNGQMSFPYTMNPGPCPTTNALRIMAMEGLPVGQNTPVDPN